MGWLKDAFQDYPEIAVFLTLGLGFLLGRLPLGKGIKLGLVPGTLIVGLVVGDVFELTIPKPIMLGVAAGGQTATAALGAITETARSQVPVLGYTVPYAVSNVLLTIWGTVIIVLVS